MLQSLQRDLASPSKVLQQQQLSLDGKPGLSNDGRHDVMYTSCQSTYNRPIRVGGRTSPELVLLLEPCAETNIYSYPYPSPSVCPQPSPFKLVPIPICPTEVISILIPNICSTHHTRSLKCWQITRLYLNLKTVNEDCKIENKM